MSQLLPSFEIELPDYWERLDEPANGAAIQAFGPAEGGFRSNITVDVYPRQDGGGDRAHIGAFHDEQLNDLALTMTDALVIDDAEVDVSGLYARTSSIVFRQGPFTVTSRVWTVESPGAAVTVVFMCDADRFVVEGPAIESTVASLTFEPSAPQA